MVRDGFRLGVDFGTSNTVAVLAGTDGRVRPLLFDGSPLLASAVFAGPDGELLVGADALRAAVGYPAGLEPHPKRRIDDGAVWLGEREYPLVELVAAVLRRVGTEASRVAGGPVDDVVLTHPAAWARPRLGLLAEAAERAGLGPVRFVAEPVAAAAHFAIKDIATNDIATADVATTRGRQLPAERCIVVYDLGAGTFDVSVVRPGPDGFEVVAAAGLSDVGGLDLDAAVVRHARTLTTGSGEAWQRLDRPRCLADQQASQTLWHAARAVKEQLSRHPAGDLYVPLVDCQVHLTRDEFEKAARPHLDRTAALTGQVLADAGLSAEDVGRVFLVGGSSRIPLAATLLHRTLRIAPTVIDQPELVVAEGALHTPASTAGPAATAGPAVTAGPAPSNDPAPPHDPAPSPNRRPARIVAAIAAGAVLLAAIVLVAVTQPWRNGPDGVAGPTGGAAYRLGDPLTGHADTIYGLAFSPDGRTLATVGSDRTVRLWDAASRQPIGEPLRGHTDTVYGVAFSPDGAILATGSWDKTVRLWDVTGRQAIGPLPNTSSLSASHYVFGVAFSPDGRTLAAGANLVSRWDMTSRQPMDHILTVHPAHGVAFSPQDARVVATVGDDTGVWLWDASSRSQPIGGPLTGHTDEINCVAFSPDGTILATGSNDRTVRLWDLRSRQPVGDPLTGHTGVVLGVAFSPDGTTLATASTDGTTRLWNVTSRQPVDDPLAMRSGPVTGVAFSSDGRTLATTAGKYIQLWRLSN